MIKLITPKRDLYMDGDTSNPLGLFGKKGKFYEVKGYGYAGEDIMFIDERGVEHSYGVDFVDADFWTVDFDKGFEFRTGAGDEYSWIKGTVTNISNSASSDWSAKGDLELAEVAVLGRSWNIIRFSNQQGTSIPDQSRPYENWKKDIGIAKFLRCLDKINTLYTEVEGIQGYLDPKEGLFYYNKFHLGQHSYICCKVEEDYDASFNIRIKFIRHNKDTDVIKEKGTLLEAFKLAAEEGTLMDEVNTRTDKILASFGIPVEDKETFNLKCQLGSEGTIVTDNLAKKVYIDKQGISKGQGEAFEDKASVCTSEQGIASDGGKSEYYKIVLPQWLLDRQEKEGYIMLEDLAEVMYDNDFNFVNVFKAQKRMFEMQQGKGKKGNTLEYDATKVKYYVDKQLEVFNR